MVSMLKIDWEQFVAIILLVSALLFIFLVIMFKDL
jgi:hypothetical protein